MSKTYALRYTTEPGQFQKHEVNKYQGLCDALVLGSITQAEDGSKSFMFYGVDGKTASQLGDGALFQAWSVLASQLSESNTLDDDAKVIADIAFESVRKMILDRKATFQVTNGTEP